MSESMSGHHVAAADGHPARPAPTPAAAGIPALSEGACRALADAAGTLRSATAALGRRPRASAALRVEAGALQQAVCDCVRELMAAGEPPDRVLLAVKRAALDAGVPPRGAGPSGAGASGALMDRIVRWCIEAYYRDA